MALAELRSGKFFPAYHLKCGKVVARQLPNNVWRSAIIFVAQNVADISDLAPGDFRVARLQVPRQVAARLGNDLDAPLHDPALLPVSLEHFEGHVLKHAANPLNRFDYVSQTR